VGPYKNKWRWTRDFLLLADRRMKWNDIDNVAIDGIHSYHSHPCVTLHKKSNYRKGFELRTQLK